MERYTFQNLGELRDFLNGFQRIDLETVHPDNADLFVVDWHVETLSDGSEVYNAGLKTT